MANKNQSAPSFKMVQDIISTLPSTNYFGIHIPIQLVLAGGTKIDLVNKKIYIDYSMVVEDYKNCATKDERDLEKVTRGLVYHEVAHAILTKPKQLETELVPFRFINVFEDERIEWYLKDYFLDTDFWLQRFRINNTTLKLEKSTQPRDFFDFCYKIVRFHIKSLLENESVYNKVMGYICNTSGVAWYFKEAYNILQREWEKYQQQHPQPKQQGDKPDDTDDNGSGDQEETQTKGGGNSTSDDDASNGDGYNENDCDPDDDDHYQKGFFKDRKDFVNNNIRNIFHATDTKLDDAIRTIVNERLRKRAGKSGVLYTHTGRFDVRRYANPCIQDASWFKRNNIHVDGNYGDKIKFNLFVDGSTSFTGDSTDAVNNLIRVLQNIEKEFKEFKFDVVQIEHFSTILEKGKFLPYPSAATVVPFNLENLMGQLTERNYTNYNLVVYDGGFSKCKKAIDTDILMGQNLRLSKLWDTKNSVVICDYECRDVFDEFKNAEVKYMCTGFASEFTETVIELLTRLLS